MPVTGGHVPDQYSKLIGYTFKYPYLVGITTESGNLGTGILISARFVLTCGHVLHDSTSANVISQAGCTAARVQKVDECLDLALLELARPISAAKAKFTDSPLQPGAVLLAAGVQETPGRPEELSVAEIELKYKNKNDADGKILDIQLEGGARSGYSGGPLIAEESGSSRCVGVIRLGGSGASSSNAIGLASIQAFLADYVPDMPQDRLGAKATGIRRPLVLTAILLGMLAVGATAKWLYVASHSLEATSGTANVGKPEPENSTAAPAKSPLLQTPTESTGTKNASPPQTPAGRTSVDQGSPDVRVWVNTESKVYHCPGTRSYGKTTHGTYMTQADAQKKANRPAYGKVCK